MASVCSFEKLMLLYYILKMIYVADPDMTKQDGIYSGYYKPEKIPGINRYRISIMLLEQKIASSMIFSDPFSYAIPINQGYIIKSFITIYTTKITSVFLFLL